VYSRDTGRGNSREGGSECTVGTRVGATVGKGGGGLVQPPGREPAVAVLARGEQRADVREVGARVDLVEEVELPRGVVELSQKHLAADLPVHRAHVGLVALGRLLVCTLRAR